jgi:phosphatidylglycerophosphate synthase
VTTGTGDAQPTPLHSGRTEDPLEAFIRACVAFLEGEKPTAPVHTEYAGLDPGLARAAAESLEATWRAPLSGRPPPLDDDPFLRQLEAATAPALSVLPISVAAPRREFERLREALSPTEPDWDLAIAEAADIDGLELTPEACGVRIGRLAALAARAQRPEAPALLRRAAEESDAVSRREAAEGLRHLGWFFDAEYPRSPAALRDVTRALRHLQRDQARAIREELRVSLSDLSALGLLIGRRPSLPAAITRRARRLRNAVSGSWIEVGGSLTILAVFAVVFSSDLSLVTALALLGLGFVFLMLGLGTPDRAVGRSDADTSGSGAERERSQYGEALSWCFRGDYVLAEEQWKALARRGDTRSVYSLGVLYAVTNSAQYHERARRHFSRLLEGNELACSLRSRLAIALLDVERSADLEAFKDQLRRIGGADGSSTRGINRGEEVAASFSRALLRLIKDDASSGDRQGRGRALGNTWRAFASNLGDSGNSRVRTCALSQLMALSLPIELDTSSDSLKMLVPVEYAPDKEASRWHRLGLIARADVPVLRPDGAPSESAYSMKLVDRCARWLLWRGFRGNAVGIIAFVVTGLAAYLIATDSPRWAGLAVLAAALMDTVDGRIAQIGSQNVARALFLDYVLDRFGDAILGVGFYLLYREAGGTGLADLSLLFIAACVLVSYIRAEAARLGLDAAGGVFERPHRMTVLVAGLLVASPAFPLLVATSLTTVTAFQRFVRAVKSSKARVPLADNVHRLSVMSVGEESEAPRTGEDRQDVG